MSKTILIIAAFFCTAFTALYAQQMSYEEFQKALIAKGDMRTWSAKAPPEEGNEHLSEEQYDFLSTYAGGVLWTFDNKQGMLFECKYSDDYIVKGKYSLHGGVAGNFIDLELDAKNAEKAKSIWLYSNYRISFRKDSEGTLIMRAEAYKVNTTTYENDYYFVVEFEQL